MDAILPERCYVVGLGKSGLSTAKWLHAQNRLLGVWDDTPAQQELAHNEGLSLLTPENAFLSPERPDALVLSPGIPHTHPLPHRAAKLAKDHHCPIIGDIELYSRAFPHTKFIGVTGTNGKSTTTALVAHMLSENGIQAEVGGNIGIPCFDRPDLPENTWYVLELSSYQLELCSTFSPHLFIVLNITPDHLDRYASYDDYAWSKLSIVQRLPKTAKVFIGTDSEKTASLLFRAQAICHATLVPFSAQNFPLSLDDCPRLPGMHSKENAMAAYLIGHHFGLSDASILSSFKSFQGLQHRQELITDYHGVKIINDSKATNFESAEKAVNSYQNIHWLVGGRGKGDNIMQLQSVFPNVAHVYFFGESGPRIKEDLQQALPSTLYSTLEEATTAALDNALSQNTEAVVLLSPACASFDQFRNFEHRGETFKNLVNSYLEVK